VNKLEVIKLYVDNILVQLVSDGATAQLKRDWCSCAALCHHVSDSSISITLPITDLSTSVISHLLLLLNCASTPFMALDASVISDKGRIEVTGASVLTLSAGLLQCYTSW